MSVRTDRDRLKPCPFCGGEADVMSRPGSDPWDDGIQAYPAMAHVECVVTDCEAMGPIFRGDDEGHAREQAIEAWNRRAE